MEKVLCGVDLGGTKLSIGLLSIDGRVIDKQTIYNHQNKPEDMLVEHIALTIKGLLRKEGIDQEALLGIGVGFPGHLRFQDGVTITTSNLAGFKNYPFRDKLQHYFKVRVTLDNDANAQAYGEFQFGAGRGFQHLIFITLSTGIGAGIIIDRKVFRGHTGTAGEIGHTIIDAYSKTKCTCGNYGCFMACASGLAIPELYRKKVAAGVPSTEFTDGHIDEKLIDGRFIKNGFDAGDPASRAVIDDFASLAGIGLYNIFQTFNPPLILLGGGLTNWGDYYLEGIKEKFFEMAGDMLFDPIEIRPAALKEDAGLVGAAALCKEILQ